MKYQELVDKTLDHIQCFHEGEIFHIVEVMKAERTVSYYCERVLHYVTYRRDGMTEWGVI